MTEFASDEAIEAPKIMISEAVKRGPDLGNFCGEGHLLLVCRCTAICHQNSILTQLFSLLKRIAVHKTTCTSKIITEMFYKNALGCSHILQAFVIDFTLSVLVQYLDVNISIFALIAKTKTMVRKITLRLVLLESPQSKRTQVKSTENKSSFFINASQFMRYLVKE